jgi:drug/metabolite transporter (DMT)-like permease
LKLRRGTLEVAMKETRNTHGVWPYLALAAGVLCIAWSAIFVRWTDIPGPASAFYRLLIPTVVLLPTWFIDRGANRVDLKTLTIIATGGLFFALDLAFFNTSILVTSAANATILGNNTPIFVGLLTWLVFRRRPKLAYWLGLALAISGSLVIVRGDLLRHMKLGSGDAMALTASACFGAYLLATERVRAHTSTLGFLRPAILSSTIFLFLINLGLGISLAVPHGRTWAALLGLGLISQLGGYLALTYALGHLPATVTSVSLLIPVPLTAILAAVLLGEPLSGSQILGGAFVLAGIGLANRRSHPAEEANATLCEAGEHENGELHGMTGNLEYERREPSAEHCD